LWWWVLKVTLLPDTDRANASGYGQFVLAAAALIISLVPLLKDWGASRPLKPNLDELADIIAVSVRTQWTTAAFDRGLRQQPPLPIRWHRSLLTVTGPLASATAPRGGTFEALPGLSLATASQLRKGTHRTLHRIYGSLPSGRLIITGAPGSGKSSAAILLLLEALDFRDHAIEENRTHIPVPVLFTLAGWNPVTTTVHAWLATKLTELAPLSGRLGQRSAIALLAAGRISVILDGLDEIPRELRPTVLRALADQATFRLILLTRTEELASATEHQILTGAACIELDPLNPTDAVKYLQDSLPDPPSASWQRLLEALTSNNCTALTAALANPLAVNLLRDTYQFPPRSTSHIGAPDELLDTSRFPTAKHITSHLLDCAITAAYLPNPGQPESPYSPETARHTLAVIAEHLRAQQSRDIVWWQISSWLPVTSRVILSGVSIALPVGLTLGIAAMFSPAFAPSFTRGLDFNLRVALMLGILPGGMLGTLMRLKMADTPLSLRPIRLRRAALINSLALMVGFTLPLGILAAIATDVPSGAIFGVSFGLSNGLAVALMVATSAPDTHTNRDARSQQRLDLFFAIVPGALSGLAYTFVFTLLGNPLIGAAIGFASAVGTGLSFLILSKAFTTALGQLFLSVRHHIPVRLLLFLADAHKRHILRSVGTVYQFRHATLQDHLAPPHQPNSP
jgi:hypothetical protein